MTGRGSPASPPVVLAIGGSDSCGGAGVQADLRTLAAHGVFAATAITAITVQDTVAVRRVVPVEADVVRAQIEAVLNDMPVVAVKIGMLATAAVLDTVVELAAAGRLPNLVVDPVLASSSGRALIDGGAIAGYRRLAASCRVFTPNVAEASRLLGVSAGRDVDAQRAMAEALGCWGAETIVVTGGDVGAEAPVVNVVWHAGELTTAPAPRVATRHTHGSGCSFASAIAAHLANGSDVATAIRRAVAFVHDAISGGSRWALGHGTGPLDHFGWSYGEETRT